MSFTELVDSEMDRRDDKVESAVADLRQKAKDGVLISLGGGEFRSSSAELKAFIEVIYDEVAYGHQVVARALNRLGYGVDRKQVHAFREKLRLGRVNL